MRIFALSSTNAPFVAEFMARIKPEWWSIEGALETITSPGIVGWYMGEREDAPVGFIHLKELESYSCGELESWGFDDNGVFTTGEKLAVLFDVAEQYVASKGFRLIRATLTWAGNENITNYAEELMKITNDAEALISHNPDKSGGYVYLLSRGYRPAGFIPNCYGVNIHGNMLVKNLCG